MSNHQAHIVVGLGYGDEGKGSIVDALVRKTEAPTVIRFNGGAQAGHNVVLPDGRHHCFSQWGAGTFAGAKTHLSRFTIFHPLAAVEEAKHLESVGISDPWSLLTVDGGALVTTPYHQSMNRLRELARGENRHGSCGVGVGETVDDYANCRTSIKAVELHSSNRNRLSELLADIQQRKRQEARALAGLDPDDFEVTRNMFILNKLTGLECADALIGAASKLRNTRDEQVLQCPGNLVFEGAQGILLDENFGFHPHTTWSTTTSKNAHLLLKNWDGDVHTVGVVRTYSTRHGAGPFVTQDEQLAFLTKGEHNVRGDWQGDFRFGRFDGVATRHAIAVDGKIDSLAITHLDKLSDRLNGSCWWKACYAYSKPGLYMERIPRYDGEMEKLLPMLEDVKPLYTELSALTQSIEIYMSGALGLPISIESYGPTHTDKHFIS